MFFSRLCVSWCKPEEFLFVSCFLSVGCLIVWLGFLACLEFILTYIKTVTRIRLWLCITLWTCRPHIKVNIKSPPKLFGIRSAKENMSLLHYESSEENKSEEHHKKQRWTHNNPLFKEDFESARKVLVELQAWYWYDNQIFSVIYFNLFQDIYFYTFAHLKIGGLIQKVLLYVV